MPDAYPQIVINVGQNTGDASEFLGTKSLVDDRDLLDSNSCFESGNTPIP